MIRAGHELQLGSGLLLAVPIPEDAAAEGAAIQRAIEEALAEADARGIAGAEVGVQRGYASGVCVTVCCALRCELLRLRPASARPPNRRQSPHTRLGCLGLLAPQVTPFLLEAIRSKTAGASLAANIRLVKNNAAVGAQVAAALAAIS